MTGLANVSLSSSYLRVVEGKGLRNIGNEVKARVEAGESSSLTRGRKGVRHDGGLLVLVLLSEVVVVAIMVITITVRYAT